MIAPSPSTITYRSYVFFQASCKTTMSHSRSTNPCCVQIYFQHSHTIRWLDFSIVVGPGEYSARSLVEFLTECCWNDLLTDRQLLLKLLLPNSGTTPSKACRVSTFTRQFLRPKALNAHGSLLSTKSNQLRNSVLFAELTSKF